MNVFDLMARISLDTSEYESGMRDAQESTDTLSGKIGSGLATAGKVAAAGIAAATAAVTALVKTSLDEYANYEQLVGGVETLFGSSYNTVEEYAEGVGVSMEFAAETFEDYQNRAQAVLDNANNAYQTAGLSANEYMETVTSFVASLTSSLGEYSWQAANYADMAISDMADNANKMGTSMESIQNAYQGFAKQNYTMLDNLKLGYGGTKTEMERLLADAEELAGLDPGSFDVSSFADIVEAIHIVQEEMGITGTTALEASTTISGSIASMKSAWKNFVTGLGNSDADIAALFEQLWASVETVGANVIPTVQTILTQLGTVIQEELPAVVAQVPGILTELVPQFIETGINLITSIVEGLVQAIPTLVDAIIGMWPTIRDAGMSMLSGIVDALPTVIDNLLSNLPNIITTIVDFFTTAVPDIIQGAITLLTGIIDAIPDILLSLAEHLPEIISTILGGLANGAGTVLQGAVDLLGNVVQAIFDVVPDVIAAVPHIISGIAQGLTDGIKSVKDAAKNVASGILDSVKGFFGINSPSTVMAEQGSYLTAGLVNGLDGMPEAMGETLSASTQVVQNWASTVGELFITGIPEAFQVMIDAFDALPAKVEASGTKIIKSFTTVATAVSKEAKALGTAIVDGVAAGITASESKIVKMLENMARKALAAAKATLGIASPSKVFRYEVGEMIGEGLALGIEDSESSVTDAISSMLSLTDAITLDDVGANLAQELADMNTTFAASANIAAATTVDTAADNIDELLAWFEGGGLKSLLKNVLTQETALSINGREFGRLVDKYA